MKLTIDRAPLLRLLDPAARIVERKSTIPVLANVLLRAAGETLTLIATDLEIELRGSAPAQIDEPGAFTVQAARLHDIVRKLPEAGAVSLEATSPSVMTLRCGRSRFQLNTLPESDFPDISGGEMSHHFTLSPKALTDLIGSTQFAVSSAAAEFYLNGIFLHETTEDDVPKLAGVATNKHIFGRLHLPLPEGAAGMPPAIIATKTIGELSSLIGKTKADVAISMSAGKIRFVIDEFTLTSRLIEATYPPYQRVIPKNNDLRIILDASAFAGAVARVATISGERGRMVKLSFTDGQVTLLAVNADVGEAREELDCDYDGAPIEVGFNARYLSDILAVLGGDTVLMKLADPGAPAILQTRDGADLLTVLMPMRV